MGFKNTIAVYGLFGQQNWGNEGTLKAALLFLENKQEGLHEKVVCVCSNPDEVQAQHGIPAFPIQCPPVRCLSHRRDPASRAFRRLFLRVPSEVAHWIKALMLLSRCRLVVAPGTGLLNDYASSALGRPYDIFMWSFLSKLCRCRLYFICMGAGPIRSRLSRSFIRLSMAMADYRSFRDQFSRDYIRGIGFDTARDPVFPDLAFSLPESMFAVGAGPSQTPSVVGLGLKDYYGEQGIRDTGQSIYDGYVRKMCEFAAWLIGSGYQVRLIVGDSLYDDPVRNDLFEMLEREGVDLTRGDVLYDPVKNVEELISQISKVDIVVSPRFHNIIYGIMLGKPVISLSYHEKFAPLMDDLGLSEYCQDLNDLDVALLIRQFRSLVEKRQETVNTMVHKREIYRHRLKAQYDRLFKATRDRVL